MTSILFVHSPLVGPSSWTSSAEEMRRQGFEVRVPWMEQRCAYLKLSDAYDAEYAEAGERGWQRTQLDADHLAIHTQPSRVVTAIQSLIERLGPSPGRRAVRKGAG